MSNPKDNMSGVYLTVIYHRHTLSKESLKFCDDYVGFTNKEYEEYMFRIGASNFEDFNDMIADLFKLGCTQELINYLKHAKHIGAQFILFN